MWMSPTIASLTAGDTSVVSRTLIAAVRTAHAAISNPDHDPIRHLVVREEKGLRPGGFGLAMRRRKWQFRHSMHWTIGTKSIRSAIPLAAG